MAMESRHPISKSFKFAFEGLETAFTKGRNFRIQIVAGICAVILGLFLGLQLFEWLILMTTIFSVIILELLNTAIESIVDLVSPEIRDEAKIAKDVSAAAVLIASIGSVVIGLLIFLPKLV
jgi:undecaprenol kinase